MSKLLTMYKIHDKYLLKYLSQIIPNTRGDESIYMYLTRNFENYSLPITKFRIEFYIKSFVRDTIRLWNSLSLDVRKKTCLN